jgi:hypothetical protein
MEIYYDVQSRPRYIKLCNDLENPDRTSTTDGEPSAPEEESPLDDASRRRADRSHRPTVTAADMGEQYGYGRSWREVADEVFDGPRDEEQREEHEPSEPTRLHAVGSPAIGKRDVYHRLSRAENSDELSRIVLDYVSNRAATCILFTVKSETASIWDWEGFELSRARIPSLRFPVTSGSIFTLMLGDGQYRGPVPAKPDCKWFYSALRLDVPEQILLFPVYLDDRLVAVLYADGGASGTIRGTTDSYLKLAQRLGLALKMLVLKMKIVAAG